MSTPPRRVGAWLLIAIVAIAWCACEFPVEPTTPAVAPCPWRRTVDGWEPLYVPKAPWQAFEPSLHPLIVASLEVLLSVVALVGFCGNRG